MDLPHQEGNKDPLLTTPVPQSISDNNNDKRRPWSGCSMLHSLSTIHLCFYTILINVWSMFYQIQRVFNGPFPLSCFSSHVLISFVGQFEIISALLAGKNHKKEIWTPTLQFQVRSVSYRNEGFVTYIRRPLFFFCQLSSFNLFSITICLIQIQYQTIWKKNMKRKWEHTLRDVLMVCKAKHNLQIVKLSQQIAVDTTKVFIVYSMETKTRWNRAKHNI